MAAAQCSKRLHFCRPHKLVSLQRGYRLDRANKVLADKIYMNRANRSLMKEHGIEAAGRPLGRPSKVKYLDWKAKMKQASSEIKEVDATIGTAKRFIERTT